MADLVDDLPPTVRVPGEIRDLALELDKAYIPTRYPNAHPAGAPVARTLPVRRAVLFGSWARGRQTAASDVDLLVVYAGSPRPDAYALCRRLIPVRGLEPHVYAEEEYAAQAPVVERMVAGASRSSSLGIASVPREYRVHRSPQA